MKYLLKQNIFDTEYTEDNWKINRVINWTFSSL